MRAVVILALVGVALIIFGLTLSDTGGPGDGSHSLLQTNEALF